MALMHSCAPLIPGKHTFERSQLRGWSDMGPEVDETSEGNIPLDWLKGKPTGNHGFPHQI